MPRCPALLFKNYLETELLLLLLSFLDWSENCNLLASAASISEIRGVCYLTQRVYTSAKIRL